MPISEALLTRVGFALLYAQLVEHLLKDCIHMLRLPRHSLEQLQSLRKSDRKKTLGPFLKELRDRVEVSADFEADLAKFLQDRNDLVHNFFAITGGVKMAIAEEPKAAIRFIADFTRCSWRMTKALHGLQVGLLDALQKARGTEDKRAPLDIELANKAFALERFIKLKSK